MRPVRILASVLGLTLVVGILSGCGPDMKDRPEDLQPVSKPSEQPPHDATAPDVFGELSLTFAGSSPTPGNFALPNSTKLLAADGAIKASKTVPFVPAQTNGTGKDVWNFDCTESQGGAIAGTATFKRTMQWSNVVFDKTEVQKFWGTWTGQVKGQRTVDGTVHGSVTGDYVSGSSGGPTHTTAFEWTFGGQ
jgi:hypothetical protein